MNAIFGDDDTPLPSKLFTWDDLNFESILIKSKGMKRSTVVLNDIPCKYCWVCLYSDDLGQVLGWRAFRWRLATDGSANSSISCHSFDNWNFCEACVNYQWIRPVRRVHFSWDATGLGWSGVTKLAESKGSNQLGTRDFTQRLRDENKTICKESADADSPFWWVQVHSQMFKAFSGSGISCLSGTIYWSRNQPILLACRHLSKVKKLREKDGQNQQTQACMSNWETSLLHWWGLSNALWFAFR